MLDRSTSARSRLLNSSTPSHQLRTYDMLRTLAAVAARATARAAERYGRRRILETITGGVTLADILLRATTKLPQRTASLPVPAAREASAALPRPALALSWLSPCSGASRPASPRTGTASALVPGCRDEEDTTSATCEPDRRIGAGDSSSQSPVAELRS
jgi:hypothetical protein